MLRRSASFNQNYRVSSSCSDSSTSSKSSTTSDSPLRRFNRLLRASVTRRWGYFRRGRSLRRRGRSVSDAGLCDRADNEPDVDYLTIQDAKQRRSLAASTYGTIPGLCITSVGGAAGAGAAGGEEASDGSDAERPRSRHLRVPTPHGPSTGNFSAGAGAGGCGAPRSAPATPLQIEPPRHVKPDKHAVKPLSSSTPSVRTAALSVSSGGGGGAGAGTGTGASSDASEGKTPSKARQKKFLRHFPQVGPDERVLNYYSCALVGDILLQGHLYITKNYFAFYSNVFGYVTKLLIPTASVQRVSKEKMARIIPNAVGVCTRDERHVFGSLLSRDNTYKLMTQVWKLARVADDEPPPQQDLPISEVELDASEYSPEDESSSGGGERPSRAHTPLPPAAAAAAADAIISTAAGVATVIQPALLTGGVAAVGGSTRPGLVHVILLVLAVCLAVSAVFMAHQLYAVSYEEQMKMSELSGPELYSEVARWRARLHGRAAAELHTFLHTNLMLLTKVRQSLETLSNVILSDMGQAGDATLKADLPKDATFS